jgi:hypothetical protein
MLLTYMLFNAVGTQIGIRYGKLGKTYVNSFENEMPLKKWLGITLYVLINLYIWMPAVLFRIVKAKHKWNKMWLQEN